MLSFRVLTKRALYFCVHPLLRLYYITFKPKTYGSRAIVVYKNEILLIRNIGVTYWSLPGGKIEKGETPENCLLRELKEEVDLSNLKIEYKLGTYLSKHEGKRDVVHIFVVSTPSLYHKQQWEIEESRWFLFNELPGNLSPATKRRLEEFKRGKRSIAGFW